MCIVMALHIVLVEPEIPANTGNIARTCAATGSHLHLVRPLGFRTDDATLKRAGLDYWDAVSVEYYDNFLQLQSKFPDSRFFYTSTKGNTLYTQFTFQEGDFFVFGKETKGLPDELILKNKEVCMTLPMTDHVRSLNLSNTVAIVVYEALRQLNFRSLK